MMESRAYWVERLTRVARPVLQNLAARRLKSVMPVEGLPERATFTHLEALGRTLAGAAPWLDAPGLAGDEAMKRDQFAEWARDAIDAVTDPESPDYGPFRGQGKISQGLVDAAFLAQAVIRAPQALWERLDSRVKRQLAAAFKATRAIRPSYNNWLLFSAMVEAALHQMGEEADPVRIDYALRQHEAWYKGDGAYGDGPEFHWDYYNSFVIQPMLLDVVRTAGSIYDEGHYAQADIYDRLLARARRYAAVQERLIAPDGTFPVIGRSMAYRTGAFHLLAQLALMERLPDDLAPGQVRSALQAVIGRCLDGPGNYDEAGWLKIGLCGSQPSLGEGYISTGSLYLCTTVFLPLGLSQEAIFWNEPDQPWTSRRAWSGEDLPADHAFHE